MITQARKTFLVADASKFKRIAAARIASLPEINCFFTDTALSAKLAAACGGWDTGVITTASQSP